MYTGLKAIATKGNQNVNLRRDEIMICTSHFFAALRGIAAMPYPPMVAGSNVLMLVH
jgi:hypothetical protein